MSGRLLRSARWQARRQGRHRRLRSLERRADQADTDRAQQAAELRDIQAALLVMGAPLDGDIPPELTCAIAHGAGVVTLETGTATGEKVVALLDRNRPGDATEIWRAVRRTRSAS